MANKEHLYERLARRVEEQIQAGALPVGDKARSLREFARLEHVSVLTALQAYTLLERKGVLYARPRSGFYVASSLPPIASAPTTPVSALHPKTVSTAGLIADVVTAVMESRLTSLAAAVPAPDLLPHRVLNRIARRIMREEPAYSARYHFPPGLAELRQQVARHSVESGCSFEPEDIVITSGGMDAVNLALKAVANTGDLIAVESPTFFGLIQAVQAGGMRVIQVPTRAGTGIDLDRLEHATKKHRIKACIVMSNCHNPIGSTMSDEDKRRLARLAADRRFTIIEDDAFGDLSYGLSRPATVKKYDESDAVLLCGSFSKTIAPGLRIGWVHGGRHRDVIQRLKFLSSVAAPTLGQRVLADFLRSGRYIRHLRRLRRVLATQTTHTAEAVAEYFPTGTRISQPAGGYFLWVQVPRLDSMKLHGHALDAGIGILPGPVFSPSRRLAPYFRISAGQRLTPEREAAIAAIAKLAKNCLR